MPIQVTSQTVANEENGNKIVRVLRWFEKDGNSLINEKVLANINLAELQEIFKVSSSNPMYDCYLLESDEQIKFFQNLLNCQPNTELYDYFLECDFVTNMAN